MDKDLLYFHFSNLGLVLMALFSIQGILNPFMVMLIIPGTVVGFLVSWHIRNSRPQHMDTFTGMLSLAAVVIVVSRLFEVSLSFESILRIFSIALMWLTFFQSFDLKTGKSYAMLQFISVCLLISSVALALEEEFFYTVLLALYLFVFIFAMRLSLVCEKKRKGSLIVGEREEIMGLWQQIKVGALMFSFILIVSSIIYPFVPRFGNMSFRWIPSTIIGLMDDISVLKLLKNAADSVKEDRMSKEDRLLLDEVMKRETGGADDLDKDKLRKKSDEEKDRDKKEVEKRFRAKAFNENIDVLKIESLSIKSDKDEVPLDSQCRLEAELKMNDGSTIPATGLVDWKVTTTADVSIDRQGNLKAKEQGEVYVSASYLGTFSNDVQIKITEPAEPIKRRSWFCYLLMSILWLLIIALIALMVWVFVKSRRLSELAIKNPRDFIREIYLSLCRGFRVYGVLKIDSIAPREFFKSVKPILSSCPEPMRNMTEGFLEARFSLHEISRGHSQKTLGLFHEVKDVVLQREEGKYFWRKIVFRALLLEVLLIPKA